MAKPKMILVGGFLGAGKTTLLWQALQRLRARKIETGLITNDQAPELVDTAWLARGQSPVREVAGSCFCCNFPGLDAAINALLERRTQVILAEPVGSCTDLSATILQPIKRLRRDLDLSPFSVVLDPGRAREALGQQGTSLHPDALYILRLQLAEADIVLLNKIDLLSPGDADSLAAELGQAYPQATVRTMSARSGAGVDEWLADVLNPQAAAGRTIIEVDYDRYAEGEAVLGWLNLTASATAAPADGAAYLASLLHKLDAALQAGGISVGHVKALLTRNGDMWIGNITHERGGVSVRQTAGSPADTGNRLTINVRVGCSPERLSQLVDETMRAMPGTALAVEKCHCLKPGRPNPTHRDKTTA